MRSCARRAADARSGSRLPRDLDTCPECPATGVLDVLRGSSLSRVGGEVELADNEVRDGDEVLGGAVTAGTALRGLDEAADGLEHPVVHATCEPPQHTFPVPADAPREGLHRVEARADRPGVPAAQV